jgi:hypothetical protein
MRIKSNKMIILLYSTMSKYHLPAEGHQHIDFEYSVWTLVTWGVREEEQVAPTLTPSAYSEQILPL